MLVLIQQDLLKNKVHTIFWKTDLHGTTPRTPADRKGRTSNDLVHSYEFWLFSDFARVIQGVCLSDTHHFLDVKSVKRLWIHEIFRVYYDRLVDNEDRKWFFNLTKKTVESQFRDTIDSVLTKIPEEKVTVEENTLRNLIFCHFQGGEDANGYSEVDNPESLRKSVENLLDDFNNVSKQPMNLVIFGFALEHICKISRIIRIPRSHALLVGVGGSGRRSLTKLAAYIADYELFQVSDGCTWVHHSRSA